MMATDFESFRGQLISTLKAKGTLDSLKTQLRTELVNEIRLKGKLSSTSPASATIEARALDSLVLSHLRAMRYEYASSVLVPEARLSDHVMSDADACRVFRTELNRVKPDGAPGSTLLQLLIAGAAQRPAALLESSTQTEASDGATMELMLEQVDRKMQSHLASGDGMWPLHALEDHMLKYQKEADARCESKLQAEITHLREVELHKIRAEERVSAKAEIERVLGEQKHYYAAQQSSLRTREARAVEAMRKREADFEASCYEHRQKMLMEIEAFRTREKQHLAEMEARQRELTAAERRLEAQRALDQQQAASVARSREIELERANDELVRAARDHQQEKKHAMLEIGRQQQALADERASVQAERERDAAAVARAVLTREELAETKDKLRETETALARTASELHAMQAKVPVLQEERVQLLTRISERDAALKMSQDRCASLTEQLAAVEKRMSVQGTSGMPFDQAASIDHGVAFARLQAEHQSELRKAREQTRVALEEQRAHFEQMLRDAANEHGELSQVVREQAAQIHSLRTYSCSETYTAQASHVAESRSDGAAHSSAYASAPAACADLHHSKSTSAPAERESRSWAAVGTHHSLPPYAPPNVAIAAAASEAASHGLDREFRGEPEPDPFVASFEQSKAKLRDLDHKNAELQKQLWSATSTEQSEVRELPKLQPLPWHHPSTNRWAMTRSEAEKAAATQDNRHFPEASGISDAFQASDRSKLQEAPYTTKPEAFGLRSQPMAVEEHRAAGVSRQETRTAFGRAEIAWETESAWRRKEAESVMEAVEASREAEAARNSREAEAEPGAARKAWETRETLEAGAEAERKAREAKAAREAQEAEAAREAEAEAARKAQQTELARETDAEAARKAREAKAEAEAARKALDAEVARKAEAEAEASKKALEAEAEAARKARDAEAARKAEEEAEASEKAQEAEAEAARRTREEEAARKAEAEAEAEASRKAREAEAEAARRAREEVAAREAEARAVASRKAREAEAEAARKAREEEAAREAATQAEASRKACEAEAEAARKARELSALKQREQADAERNANAAKEADAARAAEAAREAELEKKRALFAAEAAEEEAQRQRERDEEMKRLLATQQQERRRDERAREEAAREKKEREERLRAQQEKMRLRKEEEQERRAAEAAQREKEERERQAAEERRLAAMATSKLFEKSVAQATDIDVFGLEGETDASNSLGESMDDDASGNMW